MSMTSAGGARSAATSEAALHAEIAAAATHAPRKHWFRRMCGKIAAFCKPPSHADGWSMYLAVIGSIAIPMWFMFSPLWNPSYTPIRPWVWSLPWIVAFHYLVVQILILMSSLSHSSDDIGMKDMIFSAISFLITFATGMFVIFMWYFDKYHLGGFQWHQLWAANWATASELGITVGMRLLVNRRYFASVGSSGSSGDSS